MSKKIAKEVDEILMDKIVKAVEYGILIGFIVLCLFFNVSFVLKLAGLAGLFVSAWKLLKAFLKHNK